MAQGSSIEWTDATWNPIAGCSIISPGCTNCYAMRLAGRLTRMGIEKYQGTVRRSGQRDIWTGQITIDERSITAPLAWRGPRRIFVNSMSDLFHEAVAVDVVSRIWDVMGKASHHVFQVLTKRPKRMATVLQELELPTLPNVWLGTSVESACYHDRIIALRGVKAAIRFVSFEPLLGSVTPVNLGGIDWVIVGGESGPGARPMDPAWVEGLRSSCYQQQVAFFFKQWGGAQKHRAGRLLNGRTFDEMPELRITAE